MRVGGLKSLLPSTAPGTLADPRQTPLVSLDSGTLQTGLLNLADHRPVPREQENSKGLVCLNNKYCLQLARVNTVPKPSNVGDGRWGTQFHRRSTAPMGGGQQPLRTPMRTAASLSMGRGSLASPAELEGATGVCEQHALGAQPRVCFPEALAQHGDRSGRGDKREWGGQAHGCTESAPWTPDTWLPRSPSLGEVLAQSRERQTRALSL